MLNIFSDGWTVQLISLCLYSSFNHYISIQFSLLKLAHQCLYKMRNLHADGLPSKTEHAHHQHGHASKHHYHCGNNGDGRERGGLWVMWRGVQDQKWQMHITCWMVFKYFPMWILKWSETNLSTQRNLVCSGTPDVVDKKSVPHIHWYLQNQPKKQMRNKWCLYEVCGVDHRGFAEILLGYWPGISKLMTATAHRISSAVHPSLYLHFLVISNFTCGIWQPLLHFTFINYWCKIWLKTKNCIMHILFCSPITWFH